MPESTAGRHTLRDLTVLALVYALVGWLSVLQLPAISVASPFFPPAGIALAAVLALGYRVLPAIVLGSFAFNAVLSGVMPPTSAVSELLFGLGAAAQAALGARLIQRHVGYPTALDGTSSIMRFLLLGGPLACLTSATLATLTLALLRQHDSGSLGSIWLTWWLGDSFGVIIFTPLCLTLIGHPANAWRNRRRSMIPPMLAAVALVVLALTHSQRLDDARVEDAFQRDADALMDGVTRTIDAQLQVLEGVRRFYESSSEVDDAEFRHFVGEWLGGQAGPALFGWAPRVRHAERAAFEAAQSRLRGAPFRILDRTEDAQMLPARAAAEYFPVTQIEPQHNNLRALGMNPLSLPAAAEAIARARAHSGPAATRPLRLIQAPEQAGLVIYAVAARRRFPGRAIATSEVLGLAYVAVRLGDLVAQQGGNTPEGLSLCLSETALSAGHTPIGLGPPACGANPSEPPVLALQRDLKLADRNWQMRVVASPQYVARHHDPTHWWLLLLGMCSASLLGAFLLSSTGRTRRVEELVAQRTGELARATARLAEKEASLARAQQVAHLGSWEQDLESGRTLWSDELFRVLGYRPGELNPSQESLVAVVHPEDRGLLLNRLGALQLTASSATLECRLASPSLGERVVRLEIEALHEPNGARRLVGTVQDVTETRRTEAHINYLAHYDALTGLPNRIMLRSTAEHWIAGARRRERRVAVLFMDLDRFKVVNDTLGHPIGDALLSAAAKRLTDSLRAEDFVSRVGGDEFVVMLPDPQGAEDVERVANKLIDTLASPFLIGHHELSVSCSVGIAMFPEDGEDFDTLVKHADTAMYRAKDGGRNTLRFFTSDMREQALERLLLENGLRRAIERGELLLYYQPQVVLPGGQVHGVEALVRWRHPELGLVPPSVFIPVAEECGLISELGEWILREACRQQVAWAHTGLDLTVAVNISALQFRRAGFVDGVERILHETGVAAEHIELELTESALMAPDLQNLRQLDQLRALGLTLALDDFGTGYSSLAYLRRYPIDRLKIDRSFVRDLPGDAEDAAIALATLSLARDLGLEVIAEGVETEAQRDYLAQHGCCAMQGYLFSPPVPAQDLPRVVGQSLLAVADA